jgi:rRNA maturation endonuclease Nob1
LVSLASAFVPNSRGSGPVENANWFAAMLVDVAIFSAAFVMARVIYRCAVCDRYFSRFRPPKEFCPSCGAKIQEAK